MKHFLFFVPLPHESLFTLNLFWTNQRVFIRSVSFVFFLQHRSCIEWSRWSLLYFSNRISNIIYLCTLFIDFLQFDKERERDKINHRKLNVIELEWLCYVLFCVYCREISYGATAQTTNKKIKWNKSLLANIKCISPCEWSRGKMKYCEHATNM